MAKNKGVEGQISIFDFLNSEKVDNVTIPKAGETIYVANIGVVRMETVIKTYQSKSGEIRVCGSDGRIEWVSRNWFYSEERAKESKIYKGA